MNPEKYERIDVSLPASLLEKFQDYCEEHGMKVSSRIAVLIRKDLERSS